MRRRRKGNRRISKREKDAANSQGKRLGKGLMVLIAVALGAGGLPVLSYFAYQQVLTSSYFAPEVINIAGNLRLSDREIIEAAGLKQSGVSLLNIDESDLVERLEKHPWIATAEVEVQLPNKVHIQIKEPQLLGIALDDRFYLIDQEGGVIKPAKAEDTLNKVIVTGFGGRLSSGDEASKAAAVNAFKLVDQYKAMGLHHWKDLSEVHYDSDLGYTLFTRGEEGVELRIGIDRFEERLQRLSQVVTLLTQKDMEVEYILLDQREDLDRITVKPKPIMVMGSRPKVQEQ